MLIAILSPGLLNPSLALAATRAGELAVLDFEYVRDPVAITSTLERYNQVAQAPFGIKLDADTPQLLSHILANSTTYAGTVFLASACPLDLQVQISQLHNRNITAVLEVNCLEQAKAGQAVGADALIVKGHEAGGRVAEETTFILLQRILAEVSLPVWAHGGIGLHTAAACAAAGAAGVVLDSQLALTRESPLPAALKAKIASMDGSETICLGEQIGEIYRVYYRPGIPVIRELQEIELGLARELEAEDSVGPKRTPEEIRAAWRKAICDRAGWEPDRHVLLLGQDTAFAAPLAERFPTTAGVIHGVREAVRTHCHAASRLRPLSENSPLAASNGTRYPILQGPMTRVSDVPAFAARVAEGGALPFLALALMRGPEVKAVLEETQHLLGPLPWGVGILGFVPPELRQEQMEVVSQYRPPFALIAGGRPDQARVLEQKGTRTYLHVPSPGLLRMFIQQGARCFVFEGRECGGHVGPRTSFVLWNQMVDVLLAAPELQDHPEEFHIVFAAGIHDALSAAMVSVIAAPLAERGVRIGVLIGTAYLFTQEAVASGAILETFQEQARECRNTALLTTGPGHSTRCVDSPYAAAFVKEKRRMLAAGHSAEEIRLALEELNLGRLRIASKGITRHPGFGQDPSAPKLLEVSKTEQVDQGMYMIGQVAALRDTTCTIASLHREISVESSARLEGLAAVEQALSPANRESVSPIAPRPSDIAIVGMSCLLPKASDLQTYWENIVQKVDAVTEIPKDRWDWQLYFDSNPKAKDKIYSRWGGFLDDIAFDPVRYGMPPSTLRSIEPSQLLTLEVVRAALDDAGYSEKPFDRERTSVILGAGGGAADLGLGYGARSFLPNLEHLPEFRGRSAEIIERLDGRLPEWTEDSFAGILTNVSAGRVANRFDLGGTNFTVDAACASSLAAVSLAIRELETQNSDMVIVGGVDTMQNPFTYLCFAKTHALSPRGRCRTFDETADGIAISEGIAILVFKRLADAERDGDRIYAVIKASGSSSDGKDKALTAPRPQGQVRALQRAYAKAGISPKSIGLIEAHGTGTVAGDGAEVQALTQVFSEAEAPRQGCAIGSVKSMIGHTKCSAGAAGLIKAALALHHKVLPPTLGVEKPNARANFPETPFFVNTEARPWFEPSSGEPRRAGVSAFGFGGTNFHIVLEEYTGIPASQAAPSREWSHELFLWRGESRQTLLQAVEAWEKALASRAKPELRDLAYTAWKRAERAGVAALSLAIVASSLDDLKQKLTRVRQSLADSQTAAIQDPSGIYFTERHLASEGKLAFLFPGQGSQYPRMLHDLLLYFPEIRQPVEQAVRVLQGKFERPLNSYIFPPPSFSREEETGYQQALTQTNVAQPALGAVSMAMFELLRRLGLKPDMAAGHSYGEYVALAAAGVFTPETLFAVSEARGRFIVEEAGAEPGIMAAVEADPVAVHVVIQDIAGVCLANANAPRQSVISGTPAAVKEAVARFTAQGTTARMIPVACAFHSPLVAPAQQRLAQFLSAAPMAKPSFSVYSNTTAAPYPEDPTACKELLSQHLVRPVEFVREIEAMYAAGARVFVEVGPRGVLTGLAGEILGDRPKLAVASNQSSRPGLPQFLHLLGQLAAHGYALKLDRLYQDRSDRVLDLAALPTGQKQLPPSVWLVNGARAKPLKEEMPAQQKARKEEVPIQSSRPPYINGAASAAPAPVPSLVPEPPAPSLPASTPIPNGAFALEGIPEVMAQFQQTMARFLDAQKTIMLAYLGSESTVGQALTPANSIAVPQPVFISPPSPVPGHQSPVTAEAAVPIPQPLVPDPRPLIPEPQSHAPETGPTKDQLRSQLLAIVSDRTGYPAEMLNLDLDLEADLGIDSIKRVEILGTLQQSFTSAGISFEEGMMEKLSGVRTLQAIIDRVWEQISVDPQPPAPSAASGPTRQQLLSQLVAIVSDRTGYPPEMLDLNLDLEADLGIDSIKRVEILGTFQQTVATAGISLPEGVVETLTNIRTLQGILDRIFEQMSSTPDVVPTREHSDLSRDHSHPSRDREGAVPAASDTNAIQRFTLTAVPAPLAAGPSRIAKHRPVLIIGDHPAARELCSELLRHGFQVARVSHGESVQEMEPASYAADLASPESVANLMALIARRQGPPSGIVHLLALDGEADFAAHDHSSWQKQLQFGVKSLFHVAKTAGKHLQEAAREGGASLIAATGMGGAFLAPLPPNTAAHFPGHGAIAGLVKTLALEWPEVYVKAVDLNLGDSAEALARHLFEELHADDKLVEIGYNGHGRVTLEPVLAPFHAHVHAPETLDSSSVVLITGGARGITARAAQRIAELYRPILILAGRSPLPAAQEAPESTGITNPKELKAALMEQMRARGETPTPVSVERAYTRLTAEREIRANLHAMRQIGARVHYFSVDVRDHAAFSSFIDGIYASFGHIDAVIHGAGVIEDKLILDKTPESFDRVFDTKVNSAFVLSRKLRPEGLKFLMFFSSVSGRFGNRGQGDYAAANEVLNKLAVYLDRAWPCRAVAMNWGPWDTEGMVSAEVRKQFAQRGVELIPPAIGLRMLEEEILYGRRGEAEVVIGGAGWQPAEKAQTSHSLLPLIAHAPLSRTENGIELIRKINPNFDRYLDDHRLDGQPVLPFAVATELMAEAVAQGWPEMQVTAIQEARLLQGVVLDSETKALRIVAKPKPLNGSAPSHIAVEVTGTTRPRRVHYRATIQLASRLPDAPAITIPPLSDGHAFSMDVPSLYRHWLFHGPSFQGIERIDSLSASGIRAQLATSAPRNWLAGVTAGEWLFDPLMFDSALQLLVVWAREHWDMTALPSGFEHCRLFGRPSSAGVLCELRLRSNTGHQTIHSDIFFLDAATRRVVAIVEDMQGACSKALNRLAGPKVMVATGNLS